MPQKPKLGQNFLVNPQACHAIVDALGRDLSSATVVEIGPGKGAITELLAQRAARLVVVELDSLLATSLRARFGDSIQVIHQDILTVDLDTLRQSPADRLLIIGNLPYYITSDILLHLFAHHQAIRTAVIMVQREVADRIAAHPGSRDYGMLSVTAQLYAEVEKLMTLPPADFSPPPDVHSTVLRLTIAPRFQALEVSPAEFLAFVRQCFAQKRKTLRNNLRAAGYQPAAIEKACQEAGLQLDARAEGIDMEGLASLHRSLIRPLVDHPPSPGAQ